MGGINISASSSVATHRGHSDTQQHLQHNYWLRPLPTDGSYRLTMSIRNTHCQRGCSLCQSCQHLCLQHGAGQWRIPHRVSQGGNTYSTTARYLLLKRQQNVRRALTFAGRCHQSPSLRPTSTTASYMAYTNELNLPTLASATTRQPNSATAWLETTNQTTPKDSLITFGQRPEIHHWRQLSLLRLSSERQHLGSLWHRRHTSADAISRMCHRPGCQSKDLRQPYSARRRRIAGSKNEKENSSGLFAWTIIAAIGGLVTLNA